MLLIVTHVLNRERRRTEEENVTGLLFRSWFIYSEATNRDGTANAAMSAC